MERQVFPETGNARLPTVERRTGGTSRRCEVEDRSRRLDVIAETRVKHDCTNSVINIVEDTYDVVVCGGSQQTAERDDGRETGEVHEEERGNALNMQSILEVAQVPLRFQPDVLNQTAKQSKQTSQQLPYVGLSGYDVGLWPADFPCRAPDLIIIIIIIIIIINVKTTVYTHVNGDRPSHIENSKN